PAAVTPYRPGATARPDPRPGADGGRPAADESRADPDRAGADLRVGSDGRRAGSDDAAPRPRERNAVCRGRGPIRRGAVERTCRDAGVVVVGGAARLVGEEPRMTADG